MPMFERVQGIFPESEWPPLFISILRRNRYRDAIQDDDGRSSAPPLAGSSILSQRFPGPLGNLWNFRSVNKREIENNAEPLRQVQSLCKVQTPEMLLPGRH